LRRGQAEKHVVVLGAQELDAEAPEPVAAEVGRGDPHRIPVASRRPDECAREQEEERGLVKHGRVDTQDLRVRDVRCDGVAEFAQHTRGTGRRTVREGDAEWATGRRTPVIAGEETADAAEGVAERGRRGACQHVDLEGHLPAEESQVGAQHAADQPAVPHHPAEEAAVQQVIVELRADDPADRGKGEHVPDRRSRTLQPDQLCLAEQRPCDERDKQYYLEGGYYKPCDVQRWGQAVTASPSRHADWRRRRACF